jgi:hypothetical protein
MEKNNHFKNKNMKNKVSLFIISLFVVFNLFTQSLSQDPNFTLVYSDEFNNLNNWAIENDAVPSGTSFGLFKSNGSSNVSLSSGTVKLNTTKTAGSNLYRNGVISSVNWSTIPLYSDFFVEIRSKFKNGPNASLALWFWGGDGSCSPGGWCAYREVDILEYFGDIQQTSGGIHYCSNITAPTVCKRAGDAGTNVNPEHRYDLYNHNSFNLYGCRWNKNVVSISFNGNQVVSIPPPSTPFRTNDVPLKFVLGTNMRCWDANACNNDASNFPYTSEVDYLRFYTIKKNCTVAITQIPNFTTFNYSLKKSYTLSSTTTIPTNQLIPLYATDFLQFNNGFSVPTTTTFSATLLDCGN